MKCATNDTIAYIKLLAQDLAGCNPNCAVLAILFDLSIPVNYDGFEYLKAAIVMFSTVPILMIYPWLQKYFIHGVTLGAVKE